jgi:hypothetical protein
MAQGVPGHIGTPTRGYGYEDGDPFGSFLPPPIAISENEDDDAPLRAVVFIRERTEKVVQEYINPLLGEKPRVVAQVFTRDGESVLIREGDAP